MSSISKPRLDKASTERLGREIRRRRLALGLSQSDLGLPFTKGFVSAVENGQCVPSLSALLLLAERLQMTAGKLLEEVNPALAPLYTSSRATGQNTSQKQEHR
jgi:transcriptional regulator with XRE-family HTH domain